MKLANVFAARPAIARLVTLNMAPKVAYKVLRWSGKFDAEYSITEGQRTKLLHDISGVEVGANVAIEPGTPEFDRFVKEFNEILSVDSALAVCPMTIHALIAALDVSDSNTLSVQDIAMLEPLFESDAE